MSLKLQMMHSRWDLYKSNIEDYSKNHGEYFQKDVMEFCMRFEGQ